MLDELRFELDCAAETAHFHDEMEILYVLTGRTAVMTANTNFVLNPEDFVVFNPYEHHSLYKERGNHTLSVYIPLSVLHYAQVGNIRCASCINLEQEEYLQMLRNKLAVLYKGCTRDTRDRLYILSQLFSFLAILKQEFTARNAENSGREPDTIQKALRFISEHYTGELTLEQAADHVFWSKSHFSREFQKYMGIPFADYLRSLRLNMASYLLRNTDKPVLEVAGESGFSNVNTMIANFKQKYGCTPGEYRQQRDPKKYPEKKPDAVGEISFMGLLRHENFDDYHPTLFKNVRAPIRLHVKVQNDLGVMKLCQKKVIGLGWASDLLQENIRNTIRRARREIGFEYATFHGILDDTLDVYQEDENGNVWINTTYIDMILDFLLSINLKPWIELGFTPRRLAGDKRNENPYGESDILLPKDLRKWRTLIELLLLHFIERYGAETVGAWRYAVSPALYASFQVFPMREYLPYYKETFQEIRNCLPDACISGCSLDTGFLTLDGEGLLAEFLEYCQREDCLPDVLSFQCVSCDYSRMSRKETEKNISGKGELHLGEPARMSRDPDILSVEIAMVRRILEKYGAADREIVLASFNSTHWQEELGNDTCFKSAFLFKNILENSRTLSAMAYSYLTDNTERKIVGSNVFHGGTGLVTYRGIPKAAYYAYELLGYMDGILVTQGNGYAVTRSADFKRIQIGLYNYCHVNEATHITRCLPESEQRTIDRYYGYEDPGVQSFHFYLEGLEPGVYQKMSLSVNRKHGSSYDVWMEMGAPEIILAEEQNYLENNSHPGCYYEKVRVDADVALLVSAVLDPHEIRVIRLVKR